MASDSICKRVNRHSREETTHVEPGRKLRRYGPWTLASCGGSQVPYGVGQLDVLDEFGCHVESAKTIDTVIARMARCFGERIIRGYRQAASYSLFDQLFPLGPAGRELVSLYVGGRNPDGTLVVANFQTFLVDKEKFTVNMRGGSIPGPAFDGTAPFYEARGQQFAIDMMRDPLEPWLAAGDVDAARRLLYMQLDETPENIAPPMHIVEITRESVTEVTA